MSKSIIQEYLRDKMKEISLPSNEKIKFKIRKINLRNVLVDYQKTLLVTNSSVKKGLSEDIAIKDLTEKQIEAGVNFNNKIIIDSVVYPKITLEKKEDCLCVDDIEDDDFNFLVKEIKSFSYGRQDLKSFRDESNADNTGQDGEKIQQIAN